MDSSVVMSFDPGFIADWGKTLLFSPRPSGLRALSQVQGVKLTIHLHIT
jgi:hypothetical protein